MVFLNRVIYRARRVPFYVTHPRRVGRQLRKIGQSWRKRPAKNQSERIRILLDKLEDATVFDEYQADWRHGKWAHQVSDTHEHVKFVYDLAVGLHAQNIVEFGQSAFNLVNQASQSWHKVRQQCAELRLDLTQRCDFICKVM